jgi:ferredoxin--NADP+ reductase
MSEPSPPASHCRARLVRRIDYAPDHALFRFVPDEPFSFTPGQYATLGIPVPDAPRNVLQRPFSVASAPNEGHFDFLIERVDNGVFTPRLWSLDKGADVEVRRHEVEGPILAQAAPRRRHVMAATGTGIAPFVSLVKAQTHALSEGTIEGEPHQMLIIHGTSHAGEHGPCGEMLTDHAAKTNWLRYVPTVSRPWTSPEWDGERGRTEDVLRKHMDAAEKMGPETAAVWTCGHPGMIAKVQQIARRAGFASEHIMEEKYFHE